MQAHQIRRTVVAGVDGSESALAAARWAAQEAAHRHQPLRLVHAFGWPNTRHIGDPGLGVDQREVLLRVAHEQVAAAADAAAAAAPGIEIEQEVDLGYPIPVLEAESQRAQLLVLGSRGLGGVTGLLVGSVTVALAAHAACPVVVVRDAKPVSAQLPVVVGVDDTPNSEAAIAFAFGAADARRVPLVAVHTFWDMLSDPSLDPLIDWEAIETKQREVLSERLAGWSEKYPDVQVERIVARDRPARQLLEQAQRAQLVVVGSRGRGTFAGLVLGSVSHALLHHAPCPIAVIRPVPASDQGA